MMILRERLEEMLLGIRAKVFKDGARAEEAIKTTHMSYLKKAIEFQGSVGHKIEYFLSTGNLKSQSGLDLMQVSSSSSSNRPPLTLLPRRKVSRSSRTS